MTTGKSKVCRWTTRAASAFALAVLITFPPRSRGADAERPSHPLTGATVMHSAGMPAADLSLFPLDADDSGAAGIADDVSYLEVILNEVPTGRLALFVMADGKVSTSAETLRSFGLRWPGSDSASGLVALEELPGLHVEYVVRQQQIRLLAPLDMLGGEPRRTGYVQAPPAVIDPSTRAVGLAMSYDVFAQDSEDSRSFSGWSEWRLFGRGGILSNSMVSRYTDTDRDQSHLRNIRLDTAWQLDFPDRMLSLSVGDSVTGALSWTRPTRIGGIRLSRNFALQPYRVYTPLVSFTGESVLPSTVDLFINGIKQSSNRVLPGQFQIDSVPTLSGAGQAQVAITDINGRVQIVNFSLYGTPQLLQDGMSDWSLELGSVREDYGVRSFSYRNAPMMSATGRYGLSNRSTLEGHVEATDGLTMAGMGGAWLLGDSGGVLSLAAAGSRHEGRSGVLTRAGYQWSSLGFNLGLTTTARDRDFMDVAGLDGGLLPRRTDQAYVGFSGVLGYFSINYVRQERDDAPRSRLMNVNWSRQLRRNAMLSLSANRDLDSDRGHSAYFYLSIPFDRYTHGSMSARHARNSQGMTLEARRAVQTDVGGWGWRVQAAAGDGAGGQAEVTRLGQLGQWTAGVNHYDGSGRTTMYGNVSGGFVFMDGHLRGMRRVDDAFAMVSTDGVAGVPVKLENRLVGHTDDDGILLLNRLNAWQRNLVSIDALELPVDMYVERTRTEAVPVTRSGTLVKFVMRRILSVRLVLRSEDGHPLPPGSEVRIDGDGMEPGATRETVVGFDGMVYLQDPASGARLDVRTATSTCRAILPEFPDQTGLLDLGEIVCR